MRILRHGSIYDSILREILIKKHVCIRTSFPLRVKKALIKRKYENMLGEKGLLRFRIISPEAIEYEEFLAKSKDSLNDYEQLQHGEKKPEEKFILDITLDRTGINEDGTY